MTHLPRFTVPTLLLLAGVAPAQSFNVDLFGTSPTAVPSSSFGAAAGQAGVWNSTPCLQCVSQPMPLVDLAGQITPVTMVVDHPHTSEDVCPVPGLTQDESALLSTGRTVYPLGEPVLRLQGLQAGNYDLFFYASKSCGGPLVSSQVWITFSSTASSYQMQTMSGIAASSVFEYKGNYARLRFSTVSGQDFSIIPVSTGLHTQPFAIHGFQLVQLPGAIVPMCFASDEQAPCCSVGEFGRGCPSSFQPLGALLDGTGTASVSNDTIRLTASDVGNGSVMFYQGISQLQAASPFGDGATCTSNAGHIRIGLKRSAGGSAIYPQTLDTPISQAGLVPPIGGTRIYQAVYRDPAPFCLYYTFNVTNAVLVTWSP